MGDTKQYAGVWLNKAVPAIRDLQSGRQVEAVLRALRTLDDMRGPLKDEMEYACKRAQHPGANTDVWSGLVRDYVVVLEEYFVHRNARDLWGLFAAWSESAQSACDELGDTVGKAAAHRLRGRALEGLHLYQEALMEYDRGLDLLHDLQDSGAQQQRVRLHREKARYYNQPPTRDLVAALQEVEEGLQEASVASDLKYEMAELLSIKGVIHRWDYHDQRELEEALTCFEESLAICQQIEHQVLAVKVRGNMGLVYKDKGEYQKARRCFKNVLEVSEELDNQFQVALAYANLGTIAFDLGDYTEAVDKHEKALKQFEELEWGIGEAQQCLNLAEVNMKLDSHMVSKSQLDRAERILQKIEWQWTVEPFANLRRLRAELCLAHDEIEQALDLIELAQYHAQDQKPPLQAEIYVARAQIDEKRGDVTGALEAWQQVLHIYRDVMGNSHLTAEIEAKIAKISPPPAPSGSPEPPTGAEDSLFDVFVSYSHHDQQWVRNWLVPQLEGAGIRVCIDFRDFAPDRPSLINMENAVEDSRRTVIVLTPDWVESDWTAFKSLLVQTDDPVGRKASLIPLLLKPCTPPKCIAMLTYVDFTQPDEIESEFQRLVEAIRSEPVIEVTPSPPVLTDLSDDDAPSEPASADEYLLVRKNHLEDELTQTLSDIATVERQYRATRSVIERNRLDQDLELLQEHLDRLLLEHRHVCQQLGEGEPGLPDHLAQQLDRMEERLKSIHDVSVETAVNLTRIRQQILEQIDQAQRDTVSTILGSLDRQETVIVAEMQKAIDEQGYSAEELDELIDRLQMATEKMQGLSELPEVIDTKMLQSIEEFDSVLRSDMNLHNKVKIAVPLFFWFVTYEAELELVDLNLKALWHKFIKRIRGQ